MDAQTGDKAAATAVQVRRAEQLRRAFQRELGTKPNTLQRTLIDRASVMTAKAEAAALDPSTSANDCVRLDNCATRARAAMFDAFAAKRERSEVTLGSILAGAAHG